MARKSKYGRALTEAERADNAAFRARYEASTSIDERIALLKARGKSLRLRRKIGDLESHVDSLAAKVGGASTATGNVPTPGWRIDEFLSDIEAKLEVNLVSAGAVLASRMKEAAPVRTGALRDSIDSETDGLTLRVGSPLGYALDVEFGTSTDPAHPFMVPTMDQNAGEITDIILADLL